MTFFFQWKTKYIFFRYYLHIHKENNYEYLNLSHRALKSMMLENDTNSVWWSSYKTQTNLINTSDFLIGTENFKGILSCIERILSPVTKYGK